MVAEAHNWSAKLVCHIGTLKQLRLHEMMKQSIKYMVVPTFKFARPQDT